MPTRPVPSTQEVTLACDAVELPGLLTLPDDARGMVLFAHGSGSSRLSSRNQFVARVLNDARIGTLLFDLLTERESGSRANVFDIPLLAGRLAAGADWVRRQEATRALRLGYFGASTGAAAALQAAADDATVAAVVSRGGRPDLAGDALGRVQAPTLLIVGGDDTVVLDLNRRAQSLMRCVCELTVVPEAGHLFEEPGCLEQVAELARRWFERHL